MSDAPGSLGPWALVRRIGGGGMGEVWAAVHRESQVPAALKRPRRLGAGAGARRALANELRALARLDHPGIAEFFEHGDDPPWLAMELVEGPDLAAAPPRTAAAVRRALLQVLDALAHAHARGLLHRDVKPPNLVQGPDGRVRLVDFGVAHAVRLGLDGAGPASGTPGFAPPEQLAGRADREGPWTDLYALAATGWWWLTGALPDGGAFAPRLPAPDGLEGWLRRGLAPDPADRWPSAAAAAFGLLRLPEPADAEAAGATPPEPTPITLTVGASTARRLAGAYAFASRGAPAPIEVPPLPADWREGDRPPRLVPPTLAAFAVSRPRLVGREPEREALWSALRQASAAARPLLVSIEGEAGVGKTRLAEWLLERVAEHGHRGVWTAVGAAPGGSEPEPAPLAEALRGAAAAVWDDPPPGGPPGLRALLASDLPLLVVLTRRVDPGAEPPGLPEGAIRLPVGPLPPLQRRQLVRALLGASEALAAALDERSAGNPLFAMELVKCWAAEGRLVRGSTGLALAPGAALALPEALSDVWRPRVDAVPGELGSLVVAALLGAEPDPVELSAALARLGHPEPEGAAAAGLLRPRGAALAFAHGLLREHLLGRLVADHPRFHAAIAEALPPSAGGGAEARRGRHLLAAGRLAEARESLGRAAAFAGRFVDQDTASALCDDWERALADRPPSDPAWGPLLRRRISIAIDIGRARDAAALARDAVARAEAGAWPPGDLVEPLSLLASACERTGDVAEGLAALDRADALVDPGSPAPVRARLAIGRVSLLAHAGRGAEALRVAQAGAALDAGPHLAGELHRVWANAALRAGDLDTAASHMAEAARRYVAAGALRSAAAVVGDAAAVDHARGDLARAERGYREAIALLAGGSDLSALNAMVNLAVVLARRGEVEEALRWVDRVLPRLEAAGDRASLPYALGARWAALPPGPAWDATLDRLEAARALPNAVPDADFVHLAEVAAAGVDPERAARAAAFAARERGRAT